MTQHSEDWYYADAYKWGADGPKKIRQVPIKAVTAVPGDVRKSRPSRKRNRLQGDKDA